MTVLRLSLLIYGNLRSSTDANGDITQFGYDDNFANATCISAGVDTQAFLTKVTDALNHVTTSPYYPCTGLLTSRTDANSKTSSYSFDLLNRLSQTAYPDGGRRELNWRRGLSHSKDIVLELEPRSKLHSAEVIDSGCDRSERAIARPYVGDGKPLMIECVEHLRADLQDLPFADRKLL